MTVGSYRNALALILNNIVLKTKFRHLEKVIKKYIAAKWSLLFLRVSLKEHLMPKFHNIYFLFI